jgi:hypothetical protein
MEGWLEFIDEAQDGGDAKDIPERAALVPEAAGRISRPGKIGPPPLPREARAPHSR